MTFGFKNASATYQRAMNLIFHDLIGVIMEVYIDDMVIKSAAHISYLADLRLAFERAVDGLYRKNKPSILPALILKIKHKK
jgi:hypothetical protein